MPKKYKRAVEKIKRKVKPYPGRTKEESAHAIATAKNIGDIKEYRAKKKAAKKRSNPRKKHKKS